MNPAVYALVNGLMRANESVFYNAVAIDGDRVPLSARGVCLYALKERMIFSSTRVAPQDITPVPNIRDRIFLFGGYHDTEKTMAYIIKKEIILK